MGFKAVHFTEVKREDVKESGFKKIQVRWLITRDDGAQNFAMRYFEVGAGGKSAHHAHNWEHEVFILEGQGLIACGDEKKRVGPGYAIFIPPDVPHHFENIGDDTLKFLCFIPYKTGT